LTTGTRASGPSRADINMRQKAGRALGSQ
jgi:hypothetical protein